MEPADGRLYGRFRVRTATGQRTVGPADVVFHRYDHPDDRFNGLSPVDVVLSWLGIEAELVQSVKAGLRNAVVPGMVVSHPAAAQPMTPEQRAEYKASIREGWAMAHNHGRPFVVEGGATVMQQRLGFAGLEGGPLAREVESAVCLAFNMRPEILAGCMIGLENAPWSHMETAERLQYGEAIIPLWTQYGRTLTKWLLRPVDSDRSRKIVFDTSAIRALQPDRERNARISLLHRDIATRNQRRLTAGLERMKDKPEFWDSVQERAPRGGAGDSEPRTEDAA